MTVIDSEAVKVFRHASYEVHKAHYAEYDAFNRMVTCEPSEYSPKEAAWMDSVEALYAAAVALKDAGKEVDRRCK